MVQSVCRRPPTRLLPAEELLGREAQLLGVPLWTPDRRVSGEPQAPHAMTESVFRENVSLPDSTAYSQNH